MTLTIDKSVGKVAAWVIVVLFFNAILMGAGIMTAVWMIQEYKRTEREVRLQRLETDELKAAVIRAGINIHEETDSP